MSKNALLLYPNQLFAVDLLPKDVDEVVLVEEPLIFGTDSQYPMYVHKQKIAFMRACMRRYMEEELWTAGYQVDYIEFHRLKESGDIIEKLKHFDHVSIFEVNDDVLGRRLVEAINSHPDAPGATLLQSPGFYLSNEESDSFFSDNKHATFHEFYQWQRERFNVLIDPDTYKPLEGKWSFENKPQKRISKKAGLPSFQVYGSNDFVKEAIKYTAKHFADNPGGLQDFPWPTSRQESRQWLLEFVENRLENYSAHEEYIETESIWGYHGAISPMLNVGLLSPQEVVDAAVNHRSGKDIPLESVESFVRQILGRREYSRGVYRKKHVSLRTANDYGHHRKITADWYNGTTGIKPVDDLITKVNTRAYAHHSDRLNILFNIMFLCQFHPNDIHRWFMEMFIDTYDWSTVPIVYGVGSGLLGDGPLISTSAKILRLSHYKHDQWCDVWDGLYWNCIEKNRDKFMKNKTLKPEVNQLDRLNKNKHRIMGYRADDFLKSKTS